MQCMHEQWWPQRIAFMVSAEMTAGRQVLGDEYKMPAAQQAKLRSGFRFVHLFNVGFDQ